MSRRRITGHAVLCYIPYLLLALAALPAFRVGGGRAAPLPAGNVAAAGEGEKIVRTFATLRDAQQASSLRLGQSLRVEEAMLTSAGNGAHFDVVSASGAAPDGVLAFTHLRSGAWLVRQRSDTTRIRAEWGGARADYERASTPHTDNAKAFTKIEAFIRENPGTTVELGAGAYGFDTVWTFDNPQRFALTGEGAGTTEIVFAPRATYDETTGEYEYARGIDRYGILIRGGEVYGGSKARATHGTFRDLTIRGHANAPDALWTGIDFRGQTSHMTFENIEVAYFGGQGIRNASHRDSGDHFRYLDSEFHHISTWDMLPTIGVGPIHRLKSHAVVRGNRFWASGVNGAAHAIYFDGYGEDIRVIDNEFDSFYPGWDPATDPRHEQVAFCDVKIAQHDGDQPKNTGDVSNNTSYEDYNVFKNVVVKDNVFRRSFSNMQWSYVDSLTATGNRFEDTMLKIHRRATNVDLRGNTFTRSTNYDKIENVNNKLGVVYIGANSSLKIVGAGEGIDVENNTFRDSLDLTGAMPFVVDVLDTGGASETTFTGNHIEGTRGLLMRSALGGTVRLTGNTITTNGRGKGLATALYVRGDYGGRVYSEGNTYRYKGESSARHGRIFRYGEGVGPVHSVDDTFVLPSGAGQSYISKEGHSSIRRATIRVE